MPDESDIDEIVKQLESETKKENEKAVPEKKEEVDDYNGVDTIAELEMLKDKEKSKYGLL